VAGLSLTPRIGLARRHNMLDSLSLDIAWISLDHATTWCTIGSRSAHLGTPTIDFVTGSIDFGTTRGDLGTRPVDFDGGSANFSRTSVDLASICCVIDSSQGNCDGRHRSL